MSSLNIPVYSHDVLFFGGDPRIDDFVGANETSIDIDSGHSHGVVVIPIQTLLGVIVPVNGLVPSQGTGVQCGENFPLLPRSSPESHGLPV